MILRSAGRFWGAQVRLRTVEVPCGPVRHTCFISYGRKEHSKGYDRLGPVVKGSFVGLGLDLLVNSV